MDKQKGKPGSNINDVNDPLNDMRKHIKQMGGLENVDPRLRGLVADALEGKAIYDKNGDWQTLFNQLMAFAKGTGKDRLPIHLSGSQAPAGKMHPDLLNNSGKGVQTTRTAKHDVPDKGVS